MAQVHVMGPFKGPGEEKTVETLGIQLPDDWDIVACKSLPGTRDDLDMVVIAPSAVFLLEEKAWGPQVAAGDIEWVTTHRRYPTPIDRVSHLSRVLAGWFRTSVDGYQREVGGRHAVVPGVVLSHDHLELSFGPTFDRREFVEGLRDAGAATELVRRASLESARPFSHELRAEMLGRLTGLESRNSLPTDLGDFAVDMELSPVGYARVFLASSLDDARYLLRCVPKYGWGPDVDVMTIATRESQALRALDRLHRAPRSLPPFLEEGRQWIVTPIELRTNNRSLARSVRLDDPHRPDGHLPIEVAARVVHDAFVGLAEVHAEELVHRGLAPTRITLGRALRVEFSDFVMAHLEGTQSIGPWLGGFDQDISRRYRAPECAADPRLATARSDVFALAFSLGCWLAGDFELSIDDVRQRLKSAKGIGEVLELCLSERAEDRPTAQQAAERLAAFDEPPNAGAPAEPAPPDVFEHPSTGTFPWAPSEMLDGRYELRTLLGEGAFAKTWRAFDHNRRLDVAIKVFRDLQAGEAARREHGVMASLVHERCARTWDIGSLNGTVYLVNEFVDGDDLETYMGIAQPDARRVQTIALCVLDALAYLHSHQFIHRDVSPRNVIVDSSGNAKLIDFGLTSRLGGKTLAGTPPFMAPELFQGVLHSESSDLYALAASLLTCMLGRLPYIATGMHREGDPPTDAERALWGPLGSSILDVLYSVIDAEPGDRPASAATLRTQIETALDLEPTPGGDNENPTVESLRQGYRGSSNGSPDNRGLDTDFLISTYVPTKLDEELLPEVLARKFRAVLLTGNPGDGKTAFLVKVRGLLLTMADARLVREDAAGWTIRIGEHEFVAVYDASESNGQESSDDLMQGALEETPSHPELRRTVLIAINDGRLLQFFTDHEHLYDDHARAVRAHFNRSTPPFSDIAIVDLKERSLASLENGASLAVRVTKRFIDPANWAHCDTCASRNVCPMLRNAMLLRGPAEQSLAELVLTSHLRRQRRATFRDLRSALGWIITADLTCAQVHEKRRNHQNACRDPKYRLENLAFDSSSADYLVQEWTLLDPGVIAAPDIARSPQFIAAQERAMASLADFQRATFFGSGATAVGRHAVRAYRYFDEFTAMLRAADGAVLERILLGISRIVGASGYRSTGLAVAAGERSGSFAVLKTIPVTDFTIGTPLGRGFVEEVPDRVSVRHRTGARLDLSLDTAELIFRAADGELLDDSYSDVIRQEIEGFTAQLATQASTTVMVINDFGSAVSATMAGPNIELVQQ